jgi:hypothetical protein
MPNGKFVLQVHFRKGGECFYPIRTLGMMRKNKFENNFKKDKKKNKQGFHVYQNGNKLSAKMNNKVKRKKSWILQSSTI